MNYSIAQTDQGWIITTGEGDTLTIVRDGFSDYEAALGALAVIIRTELAAGDAAAAGEGDGTTSPDGLLPEPWSSADGIAFADTLPGGRDFSQCDWSWRDPAANLVPLMLLVDTTEYGHLGATLAGFVESFGGGGIGTVTAQGRFYDNEAGRMFRDLLLDGRSFGVSVDPSEMVDVEFQCTELDEDGWCVAGLDVFLAYEIAGLTGCPFPGFANASIVLSTAVTASATPDCIGPLCAAARVEEAPARALTIAPPDDWFALAEPAPGAPFLGTLGDEFLVEQGGGAIACPLTITDEGHIFGHLARWGQPYLGGDGSQRVTPPRSLAGYSHFHVGTTRTATGAELATGTLTIGCDHAPLFHRDGRWLNSGEARDWYAHAGLGWANVRCSDGEYGPWLSGRLRPDITDEQLAVVRSLALSGDWRDVAGHLELVGILAVVSPAFPITREALRASALTVQATPMPRTLQREGRTRAMTGAGMVARCADCQKRRAEARAATAAGSELSAIAAKLDRVLTALDRLDARTEHLNPAAAAALRARFTE